MRNKIRVACLRKGATPFGGALQIPLQDIENNPMQSKDGPACRDRDSAAGLAVVPGFQPVWPRQAFPLPATAGSPPSTDITRSTRLVCYGPRTNIAANQRWPKLGYQFARGGALKQSDQSAHFLTIPDKPGGNLPIIRVVTTTRIASMQLTLLSIVTGAKDGAER
ncbi:hypothetical protein [Bradyrhizobium sp. CCBAU 51753]|uniref:hypothetical protein n=1 Tax=Bradyrhizobium sp. CCBAU 51753 TaxID=1325100 RepID=UPI00188D8BC4|nr:hypothetical protein [Bradyrhizobium sp. CCBAU 51753]